MTGQHGARRTPRTDAAGGFRRTLALTRMRLVSYVASQRAWPPWVAGLALVLAAHAGGRSAPNQAYAFSAALLFAVFGWQAKTVLDTEPDGQRLLSRAAVGSGAREVVAGLLAALAAAVPVVVVAVVVPYAVGALKIRGPALPWLGFGAWIHLLAVLAGIGVGALASRVVVARAGWSALILVGAPVAVLVLGSRDAPAARVLVPPLISAARLESAADLGGLLTATLHATVWAAVLLAVYGALRRTRW
ncbi:hypothetical protein SAMN05421678_11080 [Actinopolymorpha cephalotaxi]|uniref:ABC-2 type transport system permease protein n=1 Tax=Actinopolymorpha cephalotaxi TaxID=504797 RepID=A0A1I2W467_9ACTN|nr:hypothetical protein [Actinopolymorpha cephalotaxi]NYH82766.1 hypothetical protein [Actinopolymorpha cephalotaxi]SFG96092.1 hypothetical protein SAMN05421678_11080 [Actinopolymorpha cephalotaxi]